MSIAMVVVKETKRFLAFEAGSKTEYYREYETIADLISDLQTEVFKYNVLDTLNQEWLLAKDI